MYVNIFYIYGTNLYFFMWCVLAFLAVFELRNPLTLIYIRSNIEIWFSEPRVFEFLPTLFRSWFECTSGEK